MEEHDRRQAQEAARRAEEAASRAEEALRQIEKRNELEHASEDAPPPADIDRGGQGSHGGPTS